MKNHRSLLKHLFAGASTFILLGGCSTVSMPEPAFPAPASIKKWRNDASATMVSPAVPGEPWALLTNDTDLMALMRSALSGNQDIEHREILFRILTLNHSIGPNAGRVTVGVSGSANVLGQLTSAGDPQNVQVDGQLLPVDHPSALSQSYAFSAGASYEVDLWHRLSTGRLIEQKQEQLFSEDLKAARSVLVNDLAAAYFSIATLDARVSLDEQRISNARAALLQGEAQYREGVLIASELTPLRANLTDLERARDARKLERITQQYTIALLLGTAPSDFKLPHAQPPDTARSRLGNLLPSEILMNRPDVQMAKAELDSRGLEIALTKTAQLPSLTLDLSAGNNVARLLDLGLHPISLGLSLVVPVFDPRGNDVRKQTARLAYAAANSTFKATYSRALVEIETAYATSAARQHDYLRAQTEVASARERLRLARLSYEVSGTNRQLLRVRDDEFLNASDELLNARLADALAQLMLLKVLAIDIPPALSPTPVANAGQSQARVQG